MTIRENKTKYAILGMLSFASKSGYEISKLIATSTAFFWSESDGQLYPILKKLHKENLISLYIEKTPGKHAKKIYSITKNGKKVLTDWLAKTPTTYNLRNEFLLQLFFGRNISTKKNIEKIKEYQTVLKQQLKLFDSFEPEIYKKSKSPIYHIISLAYGQQSMKAEIAWCNYAIQKLSEKKDV